MTRGDGIALAGQGAGALLLGAWAGHASAPLLEGAAVYGACLLLAALACGHAAARAVAVTILAPVAAVQLVRRMREPRRDPQPATRSERIVGFATTLVAVAVFIAAALAAALVLGWWGNASLIGACLRFGAASLVLSVAMPRALQALG